MATAAARFATLTASRSKDDGRRRAGSLVIEAREALRLARKNRAVFVDLRDWEIVDKTGWIEGSFRCPPGEFANIVSPSSPLHARLFEPGKIFVFYGGPECAPLASAKRARGLGLHDALALRGGLSAWKAAGGRLSGHPNSPFPVLKASVGFATRYARRRLSHWWSRGGDRQSGRLRRA